MARSAALTLVLPHLGSQVSKLHLFPFKAGQGLSLDTTSYSILVTLQAILIVVFPYLPPLNEQLTGLLPLATIFLVTQTNSIIPSNHSEALSGGFPSRGSDSRPYSQCPQC